MISVISSQKIRIWPALLILVLPLAASAQQGNLIDREQSAAIIAAFEGRQPDSFDGFLAALAMEQQAIAAPLSSTITEIREGLRSGDALSETQRNTWYRLLGIYARLRYGQEAIDRLGQLVAIPTFRVQGLPQHENPEFHRLADAIGKIATEFDLPFRNIDDRVYEISLQGASDEIVGIHAHGDVVPANAELWVLEDGTQLDPFAMTRIGERLYGRGTEDDKNGIVVSLYAMKLLKELDLPLQRELRLLIDTTEETTSDAIPHYFERNPTPNYNLALDGGYPVIIAEKGYGTVAATFPARTATGEGATVLSVTGGLASNQIPARSMARLNVAGAGELARTLTRLGADYVLANGGDFSIDAVPEGEDRVRLVVTGVSAHSSTPESGINPVSRMFGFIDKVNRQGLLRQNHITDAAAYATENWGLDHYGATLGIAFTHDFMGPLTASPTFVGQDEQSLQLTVNLRIPVGRTLEALRQDIATKLDVWQQDRRIDVNFDYSLSEPMYRNPEGLWVNALLDVATENLGLPREFGSSSGGTSVHNLPGGVQFGLAMPGQKYTGHNANEFKRIEQFLLDLQIVTEMMARIGSMPSL